MPQKAVLDSDKELLDFNCVLPCTSDINAMNDLSDNDTDHNSFTELRNVRLENVRNVIICHININSIRYKFSELQIILRENLVDVLVVTETKLDASFTNDIFHIPDYYMYRQDNTGRSGGIIVYVRDCISNTCGEIKCVEKTIEYISINMVIDKCKYVVVAMYRHLLQSSD